MIRSNGGTARCDNCGDPIDLENLKILLREWESVDGYPSLCLECQPKYPRDDQYTPTSAQFAQIAGSTEVTIQCQVAAQQPDVCDHEPETVQLDEPAYVESDRLYLPGWTPGCPCCGNDLQFAVEGVGVLFE